MSFDGEGNMLGQEDADKIRKLNREFDQAKADLQTAHREAGDAERRLKQVRTSIRSASRTRFTSWLTNSDPEEYRRYRQAKEENKDQKQRAGHLGSRIAGKDARINEAVKECLRQSNQEYQSLDAQRSTATHDRGLCEEARAMVAEVRRHIDTALARAQQSGGRETKDARKATDQIAKQLADEMRATKKRLTTLASRLRANGSFSTRQVRRLPTEFSGRGTGVQARVKELTAARAALGTVGSSFASASKHIAARIHRLEKEQRALVQKARTQVLGS